MCQRDAAELCSSNGDVGRGGDLSVSSNQRHNAKNPIGEKIGTIVVLIDDLRVSRHGTWLDAHYRLVARNYQLQ